MSGEDFSVQLGGARIQGDDVGVVDEDMHSEQIAVHLGLSASGGCDFGPAFPAVMKASTRRSGSRSERTVSVDSLVRMRISKLLLLLNRDMLRDILAPLEKNDVNNQVT